MATIKNGTFRDLSGSFGNSYLRVKNGKQEVCAKPSRYRLSMKPRPVAVRAMMKRLSFISKNLMSDKFFYDLWKVKEIKGAGPYHKFVSKNHFGTKDTLDLAALRLSPSNNTFNAEIDTFSIQKEQVQIKLKPLGADSGIDTFRAPFIVSRGIVLFTGNLTSVKDNPDVYNLESQPILTDLENPINLTYDVLYTPSWGLFTEARVLLILATLNSEKNLVQTSVTMSCFVNPEE